MKTTNKSFLTGLALLVLTSFSAFAEPGSKVIAVVNQAEWCSVCKNNGDRAQSVFMENNQDKSVLFVVNDLTSAETKKQSNEELKGLGLAEAMEGYPGTGMVYFFDAGTKDLITKISVASTNDELAKSLVLAKNGK
jgi:hypothetical protein